VITRPLRGSCGSVASAGSGATGLTAEAFLIGSSDCGRTAEGVLDRSLPAHPEKQIAAEMNAVRKALGARARESERAPAREPGVRVRARAAIAGTA
jgi:hypothetical protein